MKLPNGSSASYVLSVGAILSVSDGDKIEPGDTLARVTTGGAMTKDITGGLPRVAELSGRIIVDPTPRPACPWLIVQGDQDELIELAAVRQWAAGYAPAPEIAVLSGAEHFFHGQLVLLRATILRFLRGS